MKKRAAAEGRKNTQKLKNLCVLNRTNAYACPKGTQEGYLEKGKDGARLTPKWRKY